MDTELLKTFLEVSRTRHFGRAAEALYLTQSAVSFRIRQLENQLGVNLFTRHRNNIRLTTAGEKLLPGNRHFAPEGRQMQLVETATQRRVEPVMVDKATGEEIIPGKYAMVPGPAASPLMKYRHEYLLRKREGDSGQKFQPEPYRDASNESGQ